MKFVIGLSLVALLLTSPLASAAPVPAYRWGEAVRGVSPAQVSAGAYTLAGDVQITMPGDVAAASYALYANSVGVTRSQPSSPTGPYLIYLPNVAR